jgi:hypothetical protein
MAGATTEVMWVQTILYELCVLCPGSARLWCDNMGAKYLAFNPIFHGCMKHMEDVCHFIRDQVSTKLLDVQFISTEVQMVDDFTKALSQGRLQEFQRNLKDRTR